MKQLTTTGIVLKRINYGEADRILTIITPDQGKISVIAKGVRKSTSKLAGGIELLSISDLTFIPGRREVGTLVSTRLVKHFGAIVKDLERTSLAYELLKQIDSHTEADCEVGYYNVLAETLEALHDGDDCVLVESWFYMQLLGLMGHTPNLTTDTQDTPLAANKHYNFDTAAAAFVVTDGGRYSDRHIKALRLLTTQHLAVLRKVQGLQPLLPEGKGLLKQFFAYVG